VITALIFIIFAYLLGSVPVGVLLAKMKGQDPRIVGSGNIGATNVMRAAGKTLGIATLVGDALKGVIPTALALHWGFGPLFVALAGLAAFGGHLFPLYLKFKGGKGVATSLGVFLALAPLAILIYIGVFLIVLFIWRYVSLGSLVATALLPLSLLLLKAPAAYLFLSLALGILVFWKHRENIRRLMAGRENKMGGGKKG
jgi:acyl phosphate:glycerol-3-phosphate acyltransferase